jgi:murein DD-endopeptidase MepM/ murein hydrolase activator NlpD
VAALADAPSGRGPALLVDAVVHAYGQILFSRSRVVGALLLAATLLDPRVGVAGLLAVLLATIAALALRFDRVSVAEGYFGYNALLVALAGTVSFANSPKSAAVLLGAVIGSVFVTAAMRSALGAAFNLPALSLPFVAVFYLLGGAAPSLGIGFEAHSHAALFGLLLPPSLSLYLRSLGAIFFLPRVDVGLVVMLALLVHSRIGLVLSGLGFAVALGAIALLSGGHGHGAGAALPMTLGFNFLLVAIALGGVWFVPSPSAYGLAAMGAALCGLIALGLLSPLRTIGMPLLILPFNATVLLVLHALRQRVVDRSPKAVDFLAGSPEENLGYYRTRIARFGSHYLQRLSAPFRGRWICTQGVDGKHTHRGQWRYAADFEVAGEDGEVFSGRGKTLADYHCYRLPVLAPADGTVVKVVDDVIDNPIGEVNLDDNWGNLVMLIHGAGVYSKVCHLSPRTLKVQEGQIVRRGDVLGLCGNSGRSAVPHLHYQIQPTGRVGSPTSPVELHDVVERRENAEHDERGDELVWLHSTAVPRERSQLRNIEASSEVARLFELAYDKPIAFEVECDGRTYMEHVTPRIDLYGNWTVESDRGATLYCEPSANLFTVYDVLGERRSLLHALRAALARVPLESNERLRWRDFLPLSRVAPWPLSWVDDLVAPFVTGRRLEMTYKMQWVGQEAGAERGDDRLSVEGWSTRERDGKPLSTTRALLSRERGLELIEWTLGRRRCVARRCASDEPSKLDGSEAKEQAR